MAPFERIPKENARAREEKEHSLSLHTEDLFDEGQDMAGEKFDLASGKPFSHEHHDAVDEIPHANVEPGDKDALPELAREDDAAERWLRENDPNYRK